MKKGLRAGVGLATVLAAIALAGCVALVTGCDGEGGDGNEGERPSDEELIASYEETVPPVFDVFAEALKEGDTIRICDELFAPTAVEAIEAESGQTCPTAVRDILLGGVQALVRGDPFVPLAETDKFKLERLRLDRNDDVLAAYTVNRYGPEQVRFVAVDGEWRVAYEADPRVVKAREQYEREQRKLERKIYGGG